MAKTILDLKHWHLLLTYIALIVVASVVGDWILMAFDFPVWTPEFRSISLHITTPIILVTYPIVTGNKLRSLLPANGFKKFRPETVVIVGLSWPATEAVAIFIADRTSALAVSISIVGLAALLVLNSYPARQLKSIELRRDATLWEYIPETFQFLAWPLGIFWLQPRLNRLAEKAAMARQRST